MKSAHVIFMGQGKVTPFHWRFRLRIKLKQSERTIDLQTPLKTKVISSSFPDDQNFTHRF